MNANLITAPVSEPIGLDEIKEHLHIYSTNYDEDVYLTSVIVTARSLVENITRRALFTQTWDYYLNLFPSINYFELPLGNLQTVTHIKYTDSDGSQTTMTVSTEYLVETNGSYYGRIVLPYGVTWPSFTPYPSNPIVCRFVCGWTNIGSIPVTIKAAIKLISADLYSNREWQTIGLSGYIENQAVKYLLASERLWKEF